MNKQTEALKMAQEMSLIERLRIVPENSRLIVDSADGMSSSVYPVGFLCHQAAEALEQPARLVSYAPDKSTCTLNIDGEEVYFNREQPAQEPVDMRPAVYGAWKEPAQEPVAKGFIRSLVSIDKNGIETWKEEPFYTSPPSWQGLSDDEIWDIANFLGKNKEWDYPVMFAKTIEKALKEKNT